MSQAREQWSSANVDPSADMRAAQQRIVASRYECAPALLVPRGSDVAARLLFPDRDVVEWGDHDVNDPGSPTVRLRRLQLTRAVERQLGRESDGMRFNAAAAKGGAK